MKTEIVFILDRSGSMEGLEKETIAGYNATLEKQKSLTRDAFVTTVLFDDEYELLHDRVPINELKPITKKEYFVRGSTALLDAIGKTIHHIAHRKAKKSKILFVITTDGQENASNEYSYSQIKKLITSNQEKGWEFLFLGANIDVLAESEKIGLKKSRSVSYHADSKGIDLNSQAICEAVCNFTKTGVIKDCWAREIEKDYDSRLTQARKKAKRTR